MDCAAAQDSVLHLRQRGSSVRYIGSMPFYRFEFRPDVPVATALERLRAMAGPSPTFGESIQRAFGNDPRTFPPFIGSVEGREFHLRRDIRYRNSFLPRIAGKVEPAGRGCRVSGSMTIQPLVGSFMAVWFFMLAMGTINGFHGVGRDNVAGMLVPAGMFLFGIALCVGGFLPEAIKARRLLENGIAKGDI